MLVFPSVSASFSRLPPSPAYNPSVLAKDPIPPSGYLRLLKKHLDNLSDNVRLSLRSIENPARSGELLPLWAVTVWDKVSALRDSQDVWNNAYSWVNSLQATQEHGDHTCAAFAHFSILGWNAPLSHYGLWGLTTLALPQFLSDNRINEEAIDLMVHFLSSKSALPSDTLIAQLSLSRFISTIRTNGKPPSLSPRHIQHIEQQLSHISMLYFPSFYEEHKHWITFKVDVVRKEVTYSRSRVLCPSAYPDIPAGDSMGNSFPKPEVFIENLLLWLNAHCGSGFKFCGRKLTTGSQLDSSSCGFFAMNAISHAIFDTELLEHRGVRLHRLEWFNELCTAISNQVSYPNSAR